MPLLCGFGLASNWIFALCFQASEDGSSVRYLIMHFVQAVMLLIGDFTFYDKCMSTIKIEEGEENRTWIV